MQEEWKELFEHPPYLISTFGRVMNGESNTLLRPYVNQQDIPTVLLSRQYRQSRRSLTLLVARTFLHQHKWPHFDTPINLDGDRQNNHVSNLAWRPRWFAVRFHQQFKRPVVIPQPLEEIASGDVFENSRHAAIVHGLLESEIARSVVTHHEVFPTRMFFRFAQV